MQIRLGRISYLNTEPFFGDDAIREAAISASPRQLIELLRSGDVDLAPLPLVALLDHPNLVVPVGNLGIIAPTAATTVAVRSRRALADLHGSRIGVIEDTATSVRLLKVLLRDRYGVVDAMFGPLGEPADAELIIGDRALPRLAPTKQLPIVTDLGLEWFTWTGLPFVFALWMARIGADAEGVAAAVDYLSHSLDQNLADPGILHRRRPDLGLSEQAIHAYVTALQYRMDDAAWRGVARFRELDARRDAKEDAA